MIGIYNYTVILTYVGFVAGFIGFYFAINNNPVAAIVCLMVSGCCDMFDGKIARTKKDRSPEEKQFGIEIDSLCDLICFGALPAFIGYSIGMRGMLFYPILLFFPLAALIRLAYFNVKEIERIKKEDEEAIFASGLPVTMAALILPIVFLFRSFMEDIFVYVFAGTMLGVAILFIVPVKLKRFTMTTRLILIPIGLLFIILLWFLR